MSDTNTPTINSTIGELVAQRPSRSRIFEKLGLDYCCGGGSTLKKACEDKKMDPQLVLNVLLAGEAANSEPEQSWADASLSDLADNVEQTHHAYLRRELPRLREMMKKITTVHGGRHPWLNEMSSVYAEFAAEMESHMVEEEQTVFPYIRALEQGKAKSSPCGDKSFGECVEVMVHEHDTAGKALERMRKLSDGFKTPSDGCGTFRATLDGLAQIESDTHRHVHKENSILFPRAVELQENHVLAR